MVRMAPWRCPLQISWKTVQIFFLLESPGALQASQRSAIRSSCSTTHQWSRDAEPYGEDVEAPRFFPGLYGVINHLQLYSWTLLP